MGWSIVICSVLISAASIALAASETAQSAALLAEPTALLLVAAGGMGLLVRKLMKRAKAAVHDKSSRR